MAPEPKPVRQRAEEGEAQAQFLLGHAYSVGDGVPRDLRQARHWLGEAAAKGFPGALDRLLELPTPGSWREWFEKSPPSTVYLLLAALFLFVLPAMLLAAFAAYWQLGAVVGQGPSLVVASFGVFVSFTVFSRLTTGNTIAEAVFSALIFTLLFAVAAPKVRKIILNHRRSAVGSLQRPNSYL